MIVEFDQLFSKSIDKINDKKILLRIKNKIIELEKTDSLNDISNLKKLGGYKYYYRIRIGNYRLGFEKINSETIRLLIIENRKDIYRKFP